MNTAKYYKIPTTGLTIGYMEYIPDGTPADAKLPLVVFLHGSDQRGTDIKLVEALALPNYIAHGKEYPFVVVSPQCPAKDYWGSCTESMDALLEHLLATLPVDPDRVILTGLSMGGMGTWLWAQARPHVFAAIVPVCPQGIVWLNEYLTHLPIWAFHGEADTNLKIGNTIEMVDYVNSLGGNARLTTFPGINHDCWDLAYNYPGLVEWICEQKRK